MRAEPLVRWVALVAAAWLATGCATLAPRYGERGTLEPAPHVSRAAVLQRSSEGALQEAPSVEASREAVGAERLRRRPVRMPVGTAVDVGNLGTLAAQTGLLEVDAFEKLLAYAGLEPTRELPLRVNRLTADEAARLLALLLQKPVTLGNFPSRMAASSLLREVLEGGGTSREELLRRVERFSGVAVLRPDGYLAWVRSGRTQQKVAPVQWRDGAFRAGGFELGRFYNGRSGVFRLADPRMEVADDFPLANVHDDADVISRSLDGAGEAFFELALAIGQMLTYPMDSLAALRHLPAGVAALIASSPAYWEHFRYMTAGEQIQAAARLTTHLLVTWGTASATTRTLGRLTAGAEATVPVLSLSARGALVMERVAVPVGQAASVLSGGPGAAIILHRANTATKGSSPAGGPGQWGPARESMKPLARRYQEQITGHSADDAYWVGGVGVKSGGVKFDGFKNGVLLEAKGPGYAKFFDDLAPKDWFEHSGARELIEQADRQARMVRGRGIPIEWHVAEARATAALRRLLDGADIEGIKVVHTPAL
jgi:hypothetical protein